LRRRTHTASPDLRPAGCSSPGPCGRRSKNSGRTFSQDRSSSYPKETVSTVAECDTKSGAARRQPSERQRVLTCAVLLLIAVPLLGTLEGPGMAWDEGYTVERARKVRSWFAAVLRQPSGRYFEARSIETYWPFAREEPDGHPPAYALLALAGHIASTPFLPPLASWRLGAAAFWLATLTVTFVFFRNRLGLLPATTAVLLTAWCPRLFGHAHFALYDIPLACWWLLTFLATWKAIEAGAGSVSAGVRWSLAASAALACAAATKFTGWLIPIPLIITLPILQRHYTNKKSAPPSTSARGLLGHPFVLLAIVCLPVAIAVPETYKLVRELRRIDTSLRDQSDESGPDRRAIPRYVADQYRRHTPSTLPGWALFGVGPFLALWALYRRRITGSRRGFDGLDYLYVLIGTAPLFTLCLVPPWWPDPVQRIALFLWSNLTRRETTWIPTLFLGRIYDYALPWYNTIVWIGVGIPPLTVILAVLGFLTGWARPRSHAPALAAALSVHALTLLVVRALPTAPGHDGLRQLVPAVVFLCLLSGPAVALLQRWSGHVATAMAGLATLLSAISTVAYHPVQLSYYSEAIGGLPGAASLGLEPTYYWDALDRHALGWLNGHTSLGEGVAFSSLPLSFHYLREWGYLTAPIAPIEHVNPQWYVLLNRPGLFKARPIDSWLAKYGRPSYVRSKFGVPLILVFPIEEVDRARAQPERDSRTRASPR